MMFDRSRADWEAAGYMVAQHTKSRAVRWSDVDRVVVHYTADRRAMADTAQYLRNMQKSYVDRRGYSLGYSVAVDQSGVSWEIRGTDHMPAANVGWNDRTWVILAFVDWQDACNPAMVDTIRQLVGWAREQVGRDIPVVGHRDIASTRCPGDGIYNQIKNGTFEPVPEDLTMRIINPPTRVYDSRKQGGPFKAGETRRVTVGRNGAAFVNVTVVNASGDGFVTVWGDGPMPDVSNVNYETRQTICNTSWVPVNGDGTVNVYTFAGCDILVDVQAVAS
jgi:hypothetical protein